MTVVRMWLRLDLHRRWRSLAVLTLLVALAAGTVMTAVAGARRASTALERLSAHTLPATSAVLANTPGFDWSQVRALPQVESLTTFVVDYTWQVQGLPGDVLEFPSGGDPDVFRTIEKPIVYAGRVSDPNRADEVVVSRAFVRNFHKGVGDTVVIELPTPKELGTAEPGPNGRLDLHGPRVAARIVGVVASPWFVDEPGNRGFIQPSPGLTRKYAPNVLGDQKNQADLSYVNALVRLRGGEAAIPAFRKAFVQATHRPDIDIWNLPEQQREQQRHIVFEARCLLAFAVVALVAAMFLVGQAIVRYAAGSAAELRTLQALGMTPRLAVATAAAGPVLVGLFGGLVGAGAATLASRWFPIGSASSYEPHPGIRPDWPVLGIGWLLVLLLVAAGAAAAAWLTLSSSERGAATHRSVIATLAARSGAGIPVVVGSRFALEPGRGRTAVPVRPALIGAVTGVLGVIAVFTFSQGVGDATRHPERFGQTFQLSAFVGINGHDFGPVARLRAAIASSGDVTGVDDARIAVATGPGDADSISLWDFNGGHKALPVAMESGRMATGPDEVVLAPRTLADLHKKVGDTVQLTGPSSSAPRTMTITGSGFVPEGPHNSYADGGWVASPAFDALFATAYKYRIELVTLRAGVGVKAGVASLTKTLNAAVPQTRGQEDLLSPPDPVSEMAVLRQVRTLPVALGAFLALLAVAAVGHALATAVRRRSVDIAVLRALGMTRWQSGGVVVVQATVLAVIGLVLGVPLGFALGRTVWRVVADNTPVVYVPPVAVWALVLTAPAALLVANLLAAWPGRRAAALRVAHVLRAE